MRTVGDILDEMPVANQGIGANGPPAPTPLEAIGADIGDTYDEAKNWLDGTPIANQAQADEVTRLLDAARKGWKAADAQRVVEKKPHDDAATAVQSTWKPLLDKAKRVETGTKSALGNWMVREQARLAGEAEAARKIADAEAEAARAKHLEAAQTGDLTALEDAEQALKDAKASDRDAARADKAKPMAKVEGMARGMTLRTVWSASLAKPTDECPAPARDLARHYWERRREEVVAFYLSLAEGDVRAGARSIPGIAITSEQVAR